MLVVLLILALTLGSDAQEADYGRAVTFLKSLRGSRPMELRYPMFSEPAVRRLQRWNSLGRR